MHRKALFLDLDGTLLNDQKEVTPENRRAMEAALDRGHRIVVTSGRPLKSTLIQAHRLGLDGPGCYAIAYNGGVIYDCGTKQEAFRKALDMEDLFRLFDEANRRGVYIQTYAGDHILIERRSDPAIAARYCKGVMMDYQITDDIRTLTEAPVKALCIDFEGREKTEPMRQWVLSTMAGRLTSFFSSAYYLEIVPDGTDKGFAVRKLCEIMGLPLEDSIAAGDEANDIPMIRAAGLGVAMINGTPEAKAAAQYVTARDNNHDGIAEVIDRFMLSEE